MLNAIRFQLLRWRLGGISQRMGLLQEHGRRPGSAEYVYLLKQTRQLIEVYEQKSGQQDLASRFPFVSELELLASKPTLRLPVGLYANRIVWTLVWTSAAAALLAVGNAVFTHVSNMLR